MFLSFLGIILQILNITKLEKKTLLGYQVTKFFSPQIIIIIIIIFDEKIGKNLDSELFQRYKYN